MLTRSKENLQLLAVRSARSLLAACIAIVSSTTASGNDSIGSLVERFELLENQVGNLNRDLECSRASLYLYIDQHISEGHDRVLLNTLTAQIVHPVDAWIDKTTYVVPCDGQFAVYISFIRDATGVGNGNWKNDTYVSLLVNGLSEKGGIWAWAGQSNILRQTAAANGIISLSKGDRLSFAVSSDGGDPRKLRQASISLHRIASQASTPDAPK